MSDERSTVVFFPEGAYGPTNNCVGIGDVLRQRGHRVVFIIEESFEGTLEKQGFEERLMRLTPPPEVEEVPGQFWKDFIRDTAPVFRRPTIDQLAEFIAPTFQALIDGARYVDDRLLEIIDELDPDLVVEDNVVTFPALLTNGRPWARIVSCNPTEIKDPDVPTPFCGLPVADRSAWAEHWDAYRAALGEMHGSFSEYCGERGAPPLPADNFIHESPLLNLYLYPEEIDYRRANPLGASWHNLQASVRATDPDWALPQGLAEREGPLLYLSLGSLGSADVSLMEKLVGELADAPYRVIVSKGPQAAEYELADNMVGEEFLPQTAVLPQVDLVITHGGNNTVTESLHFGKPMIALPLFWDQYDNAQRLDETGFGIRLDTYRHDGAELTGAIDRLLGDAELGGRLASLAKGLRDFEGTRRAADLIEEAIAADAGGK
ncbi:MAG TPA: nucleotide disphospho-sugar-binding domain-containing protein [Solirubrobacterales bacterium]|nr:nucleotide disphospho-sugar-binding domain-containing protein [Solirubrobacterales bacterium]